MEYPSDKVRAPNAKSGNESRQPGVASRLTFDQTTPDNDQDLVL